MFIFYIYIYILILVINYCNYEYLTAQIWLGEIYNTWPYWLQNEILYLMPNVDSSGQWTVWAWNSIICLALGCLMLEVWSHLPDSGILYPLDIIVKEDHIPISGNYIVVVLLYNILIYAYIIDNSTYAIVCKFSFLFITFIYSVRT